MWSRSVIIELPDEVGLIELTSGDAPPEIEEKCGEAIKSAYDEINWRDGEVTAVEDYEDDSPHESHCVRQIIDSAECNCKKSK